MKKASFFQFGCLPAMTKNMRCVHNGNRNTSEAAFKASFVFTKKNGEKNV